MKHTVRECTEEDLGALREISWTTYTDAFGCLNTSSNMQAYLEQAFDVERLRDALAGSNSTFYFLYADDRLSGYLKLNEFEAQTDLFDPQALEIERIYIIKKFQGKGLGGVLLEKAIETAKLRKKKYIWLGVWEKNHKALEFYRRNGFYEVGKHSFWMGDEEQTDYIMRKDLGILKGDKRIIYLPEKAEAEGDSAKK
jgi:ribosomal protein S18 acetylase RimI-like enzyme